MLLIGLGAVGRPPQAGEIYKSFDANGHVVFSDHADPALGPSSLVQLEDPRYPPRELHFCWVNCFTLRLQEGVYRRVDGTDDSWTIETFDASTVVLHRHTAPTAGAPAGADVVFAGHVANDRLVGVTVNGKPTSGIDAAWGSALATLPGSNAERDGTSPVHASLPVSASPSVNANSPAISSETSAVPPPPVPPEEQPVLPQDGYLWTPGYWYWRDQRYVWVHGVWLRPPQAGFLWTPAYWASAGAGFVFHPGHWGASVGFYGGVNYGHGYTGSGYTGSGYTGGHWVGHAVADNGAANHLNPPVARHAELAAAPSSAPPIMPGTAKADRPTKTTAVRPMRAPPERP